MKDYYEILGVGEEASEEEIRTRWIELTKRYHPDLGMADEGNEKIREVNEAYEILIDESSRFHFDFERDLKRSFIKKARREYERRMNIRKIIILPASGILVLLLIVVFFLFRRGEVAIRPPSLPAQQVSSGVKLPSPPAKKESEEAREKPAPQGVMKSEVPATKEIPKEILIETPKPVVMEAPKEAAKEVVTEVPKEVAKEIPKEVPKVIPKETPKPVAMEAPKEIAKEVVTEVPKEVAKEIPKEVPKVIPKETPKPVAMEAPKEIAKEVVREAPKEAAKEVPKVIPKETPKPVVMEAPKEVAKGVVREVPKESSKEVSRVTLHPGENLTLWTRGEKVVSSRPSLLAKEEEVRQFFSDYVDRYNRKDVEGFLSFFSKKAVQNQTEGLKAIGSHYTKWIDQSEKLRYQIEGMKVEIYQQRVDVKARFRVDQTLKKNGEDKVWKGNIRWVLVKEEGRLKIKSVDYQQVAE